MYIYTYLLIYDNPKLDLKLKTLKFLWDNYHIYIYIYINVAISFVGNWKHKEESQLPTIYITEKN